MNFMEMHPIREAICRNIRRMRGRPVLHLFLLRSATSILSAVLGGFGMFCLFSSYAAPHLLVHAVILILTASAIVRFSPR
jgi:hypothetical protein